MTCHPDKHAGDAAAEEKFKRVGAAYHVLATPELKERYDRFGPDALSSSSAEDIDPRALFNAMFGGGMFEVRRPPPFESGAASSGAPPLASPLAATLMPVRASGAARFAPTQDFVGELGQFVEDAIAMEGQTAANADATNGGVAAGAAATADAGSSGPAAQATPSPKSAEAEAKHKARIDKLVATMVARLQPFVEGPTDARLASTTDAGADLRKDALLRSAEASGRQGAPHRFRSRRAPRHWSSSKSPLVLRCWRHSVMYTSSRPSST